VEKYGTARDATDSNILRSMRIACWKTKDTERHSEYIERVQKRITRLQIIISNNENVLQLQNKLQTIK